MAARFGDKGLAASALILALIGLLLLFLYAHSLEPKHLSISSLNQEQEGTYVEVMGMISGTSSRGGNVFLYLCDKSCITVFIPSSQTDDFDINPYLIKKGDGLIVRGTVEIYKGERELIPLGFDGLELV
ncbi:hypothetical protein DRN67_01585 [Candidatus Micrarchaeota archaeon]|nr:MAG: hypothetical protein DRN67_01585 [Candidatus Micrarchaeota archaeon]